MSALDTSQAVRSYLSDQTPFERGGGSWGGREDSVLNITAFPGGVSNYVWRIDTNDGSFVLKQPLRRLATKEEWISGTGRLDVEVQALRTLAEWIPQNVPEIRFHDAENKVCIMTCAPADTRSWKEEMMAGSFNTETSFDVGRLLYTIHQQSRLAPGRTRDLFENDTFFQELRIDPFHRFVARKYPDLAAPIGRLIDELMDERTAFVHGDYSPKNILVDPSRNLTLIDCEVAHWGNPVFDVAYCLGHLMLKGWHLKRPTDAGESIRSFLDGYRSMPPRLLPHLGLMLLARVDGKSTVEYLTDPAIIQTVRETGRSMLLTDTGQNPIDTITSAITE